ncbi:MAG: branched-chain amino acid ABC transporter permease [Beijerinckiaceae bacterium]
MLLAVFAALAALPFVAASNTAINFLSFLMIIALAAQGWNLLAGYAGQFSFGHAAFFGVGAYAMALLQTRYGLNPWLAFPVAITAGAVTGYITGYLSFRANLRGSYFALVTLAFAEVFRILANALTFTGGAAGVLVPLRMDASNFQFADKRVFYWIALACVIIAVGITAYIKDMRLGAYLTAVRENEEAAQALGVDTLRTKLTAITLSAGITAAAGCLYTQKFLYLDANLAFGAWISVEALLAPIIGGIGTVLGPLAGAVLLLGLGELTKIASAALIGASVPGIDLAVYGALLIVCVAFAPRGVLGLTETLWTKRSASQ